MKPFRSRTFSAFYAAVLAARAADASAASLLDFSSAKIFGGPGSQRATAITIVNGSLYYSGITSLDEVDGTFGKYALPVTAESEAVWKDSWPALQRGDEFRGVAANSEGVYLAGNSYNRTTDTVGGKENKGIVVKYRLTGPSEPGLYGRLWDTQVPDAPGAFPYGGSEALWAAITTLEGNANFIYVTGHAQAGFSNGGRLFLSKADQHGDVVWTRNNSSEMANNAWSIGRAIAELNGYIYVAGEADDSGPHAYLAKYDRAGNFVWSRALSTGAYAGLAVFDGHIFAVGQDAVSGASNYLIDKWDEAGNRVWTRSHDHENANEALHGIVPWRERLVAVGYSRDTANNNRDAAILEIDPANGDLLARTIYGGALDDLAYGVATDGTDLYVVGETESFALPDNQNEDSDAFIARYVMAQPPTGLILTSNPLWTDTGITLRRGDTVVIHDARGTWNTTLGETGPEGGFPGYEYDEWIKNGFHGQLIGFIGAEGVNPNSAPRVVPQDDPSLFSIGVNTVTITGVEGHLWLGMNDAYDPGGVGDNSGSVTVQVDFTADPYAGKIVLTGALLDVADPTGAADLGNYWNTLAGDSVWDLWLTANTGINGPIVNGPGDADAGPLSIDLTQPGRYSFAGFVRWPWALEHVALNLFFNGDNASPKISVKTPTDAIGLFSANSSSTTHPLAGGAAAEAAGTLSFITADRRVTVVDFRWYSNGFETADFPVVDRIATLGASADGEPDARGKFTIEVTLAGPSLTLTRISPDSYRLTWPSPSTGYRLHQSATLAPGGWTLVDAAPDDDGNVKSVNVSAQGDILFYCLIKP